MDHFWKYPLIEGVLERSQLYRTVIWIIESSSMPSINNAVRSSCEFQWWWTFSEWEFQFIHVRKLVSILVQKHLESEPYTITSCIWNHIFALCSIFSDLKFPRCVEERNLCVCRSQNLPQPKSNVVPYVCLPFTSFLAIQHLHKLRKSEATRKTISMPSEHDSVPNDNGFRNRLCTKI